MKQRVKRHTPASSDDPSYRNLPLTRGLDAKVPTELFDDLDNRWNWQAHSSRGILYARRWRQKSDGPGPFNIALHDVIYELLVGLIPAGLTVDFVNRNTLDCRKINLRLATRQEQNWNVDIKSSNTSGFIGVVWHTRKRKWSARVGTKGKKTHLGDFDDPFSAAWVYDQFVKATRGEFVVCNNPVDRRMRHEPVPIERRAKPHCDIAA